MRLGRDHYYISLKPGGSQHYYRDKEHGQRPPDGSEKHKKNRNHKSEQLNSPEQKGVFTCEELTQVNGIGTLEFVAGYEEFVNIEISLVSN